MIRVAAALILLALPAWAAERIIVTDGDSLRVGQERVRIESIDTPELRGKCDAEMRLARRAKAFVQVEVQRGVTVHRTGRQDRYGRTLARVTMKNGRDLGEALIAAGLARRWERRRQPWC